MQDLCHTELLVRPDSRLDLLQVLLHVEEGVYEQVRLVGHSEKATASNLHLERLGEALLVPVFLSKVLVDRFDLLLLRAILRKLESIGGQVLRELLGLLL